MSGEHKHMFWRTFQPGRRWRNAHGTGLYVTPTGAQCRCGATITQAQCDWWRANVRAHMTPLGRWYDAGCPA